MQIIKMVPSMPTPAYATPGSAGLDLYANTPEEGFVICPKESLNIGTGIKAAIPIGFVGLLIPRSSKGRDGEILKNTVGIIDSDYRGEIIAMIKNDDEKEPLVIKQYERFVQLVIVPVEQVSIDLTEILPETERGEGGFGSTGKH